jgi:alpha-ribazole phosphatase
MSDILFVRHAATEMAGRFCGHSDPDLNPLGQTQLAELVTTLAGEQIDRVYSSDLKRALRTAHAIAAAHDIALETRPALREIHFGEWEGLCWEEIERRDLHYAHRWLAEFPRLPAPSGETFREFEARVLAEISDLPDNQPGPIAVVTHAGVLRVVLQHFCGCSDSEAWRETKPYCCVVRYTALRSSALTGATR